MAGVGGSLLSQGRKPPTPDGARASRGSFWGCHTLPHARFMSPLSPCCPPCMGMEVWVALAAWSAFRLGLGRLVLGHGIGTALEMRKLRLCILFESKIKVHLTLSLLLQCAGVAHLAGPLLQPMRAR